MFPESPCRPSGADLDLHLVDTFDAPTTADGAAGRASSCTLPGADDRRGRPAQPDLDRDRRRCGWRSTSAAAAGRPDADAGDDAGVQVRVLVRDAPDLTADRAGRCSARATTRSSLRWGGARSSATRTRSPPSSASTPRRRWTRSTARSCVTSPTVGPDGSRRIAVDLQLDRRGRGRHRRPGCGSTPDTRSSSARTPPAATITMVVETRLRSRGAAPVPALGPVRLNASAHPRPDAATGVGRAGDGRADHRPRPRTRSCCATG